MTDKKIEEYLERARKIKKDLGLVDGIPVIEIAKMIQLEELTRDKIVKEVTEQLDLEAEKLAEGEW